MLRASCAQGELSPARLTLAMKLAAEELKVRTEWPRVVVVLGCQQSAEVVDLPHVPSTHDQVHTSAVITEKVNGNLVYYFWLVEEPTDQALANGLVQILLLHSNRPLENLTPAILRVAGRLRTQVSARDLDKGH